MIKLNLNENLYDLWQRRSEWLVRTQRVSVSGLMNIPEKGAGIIAANHTNWKDIFAIAGIISRRLCFVGTAELIDITACQKMIEKYLHEHLPISQILGIAKGFSHWAANTIVPRICNSGTIPVKRHDRESNFFELAKESLRKDKMLLIFPEGNTSKPDKIKRFRLGMAKLVYDLHHEEDNDVPVIPTALRGTERFYLPGRKLSIHIGRPSFIKDFYSPQEKLMLREFNENFRKKLQQMLLR